MEGECIFKIIWWLKFVLFFTSNFILSFATKNGLFNFHFKTVLKFTFLVANITSALRIVKKDIFSFIGYNLCENSYTFIDYNNQIFYIFICHFKNICLVDCNMLSMLVSLWMSKKFCLIFSMLVLLFMTSLL